MSITRRVFLHNSALAVVGTAAVPSFLTRAAFGAVEAGSAQPAAGRHLPARRRGWAEHRGAARRAAVLRHAAHASTFHESRCSISTASSDCIRRCRRFSRSGSRVISPSCMPPVRPIPTRSHFDAQDFMESGTPGVKATEDGWLNRSLHDIAAQSAESSAPDQRFRAIALGPSAAAHSERHRACSRDEQHRTTLPWAGEIPKPRRWPTRLRPCTTIPSTACCTARARKPSTR